ncbi:MAG: efflux RND transporter periplasmic adaptor subunit [Nitrospirota bacterium]
MKLFPSAFLAVSLAVSLAALTSCAKTAAAPMPPAIPVVAAKASLGDVPVTVSAIGNVEAYSTVSVKAQVEGVITRVYFQEGQGVKKGQMLFQLDSRPLDAALRQAEATYEKDMVQLKNAKVDAERYVELYKRGIVAKEQYDQLQTAASTFEELTNADKAAVTDAKVKLSYSTIRSPIDGYTGNLNVHEGNLVKENDTPYLVVINQVTPVNVTFCVPEQHLPDIKKFMAGGKLKVEALPPGETKPSEGTVTFIDNLVDVQTGTIKLKGMFPNKDRRLWPGQFVNATMTLMTRHGAVLIPAQAILTGQSGKSVFVVKPDMTIEPRVVETGQEYGGNTVIEKGINPGETVVTDGQLRLTPGAKVEFRKAV